jgi:ribonucleoside-diphosphate reductase alpha chain
MGRGEDEGKRNFRDVPESGGQSAFDVIKKVASAGYTRGRVPQDLFVVQGGVGATALATSGDPSAALQALVPEFGTTVVAETAIATGTVSMDPRAKAKMQGYEGDPCGDCGNYTLVRNGTCMKCNTCGATSGCS